MGGEFMYTVKGFYDRNGLNLETPVNVNENPVPVIVIFLSENIKPITSEEIIKPYKEKIASYNMGLDSDEEYSEFLMNEYYQLFGYEENEVCKDEER